MDMETMISKSSSSSESSDLRIWEYVFGFVPMAVVKCAIQLEIADVLEAHGGAMTHSQLSTALACSPPILHRIMRYLTHRGIFKKKMESSGLESYVHTPLSRLLITKKGKGANNNSSSSSNRSMAALVLLESSPEMLAPWHQLRLRALVNDGVSAFEGAHGGEDVWAYAASHPRHSKLINDAMACHARLAVSAMTQGCPEAFRGVGSLVDVGGGDGTALRSLLKAFPWIQRGINLDLPHVVSENNNIRGGGGGGDEDDDGTEIEHVAGNMFEMVPKADAAFLMWVLHDWSDEECIQILSNCREAVVVTVCGGTNNNGKVMIAEAVILADEEEEEDDKSLKDVRLALDMVMLAHTNKGKERTIKEWEHVIKAAGFSSFTVNHLNNHSSLVSLIQAYP